MTQPDLFAFTHAHAGDPGPSFAAAGQAEEFAYTHCARILRALIAHPSGRTSPEIGELIGLDYHAVARRIKDLKDAGLVIDSGKRRANPNGCMATVWRAR